MSDPTQDSAALEALVREARLRVWELRAECAGGSHCISCNEALSEYAAAVRATAIAECVAVVEARHAVILRDVERWGWNTQKCASDASYADALAAVRGLETP